MRFVADEGVDAHCVEALRRAGHDVYWVGDHMRGATDEAVLALAVAQDAVLLTFDKDFGTLVYHRRLDHRGVLLIRLHDMAAREAARVLAATVEEHAGALDHAFTVLTSRGIRVRARAP